MESSYEELRSRWRGRLQEGSSHHNFDLSRLAPNKFFVHWHDFGCSGSCSSTVELIGVFEDAKDFLAFIRHVELPRILDYATGAYRDVPLVADAYILDLEEELRKKVDWLLGLIDRALKADMIESQLPSIRDAFNAAFEGTNPTVQILASGRLGDVLASDHFEEAFELGMEEETDEDEKPSTQLKRLLDVAEFNERNEEHLVLAKSFLGQRITF